MSTPTPGKLPLSQGKTPSQQGKTPSQPHHGSALTPSVSTPFSLTQAAFSPLGPRSSPQQVKKSPAAIPSSSSTMGRSSAGPVNFDSPSAAAALGFLDSIDPALQAAAGLGKASEDERARRLDGVISIIGVRFCALLDDDLANPSQSKAKAWSARRAWRG